jgi:hypothetical protein
VSWSRGCTDGSQAGQVSWSRGCTDSSSAGQVRSTSSICFLNKLLQQGVLICSTVDLTIYCPYNTGRTAVSREIFPLTTEPLEDLHFCSAGVRRTLHPGSSATSTPKYASIGARRSDSLKNRQPMHSIVLFSAITVIKSEKVHEFGGCH